MHLYITIERQYPQKETNPKEPYPIRENPGLNPISKPTNPILKNPIEVQNQYPEPENLTRFQYRPDPKRKPKVFTSNILKIQRRNPTLNH